MPVRPAEDARGRAVAADAHELGAAEQPAVPVDRLQRTWQHGGDVGVGQGFGQELTDRVAGGGEAGWIRLDPIEDLVGHRGESRVLRRMASSRKWVRYFHTSWIPVWSCRRDCTVSTSPLGWIR